MKIHRVFFLFVYELKRFRVEFFKRAKSRMAMSGPQWRNVNASFNASRRDTMVVVAGRLTALSEDRNVLPTVAIDDDDGVVNGRAEIGATGRGLCAG